ncbi:hypothetical protein V8D89_008363 [Ganoderma adspersum]
MVNASDIWNFVSGALTLVPCALGYVYHQLPSYLFRVMDDALKETESLLSSSLEDGLIPDSSLTLKFMQSAEQFRSCAERMRPQVYRAATYWAQLKAISSGLAGEISTLSAEVMDLRAEVCATISSSRERLIEEAELAPPQGAAGTVADVHGASVSVPLGGPGTAASRFYNLAQARSSGPSGSEVTLVDFPTGNGGSRMSGGAETARACCCDGRDLASGPYAGPSRPRIVTRSYSTPSLPFEGGDAVHARPERPTTHPEPSPGTSPDTLSLSDMPSCEVDVVVDVPVHRCSR